MRNRQGSLAEKVPTTFRRLKVLKKRLLLAVMFLSAQQKSIFCTIKAQRPQNNPGPRTV
jgi:hypothetical protein